MPERPPILGRGTIRATYEPGLLYQVEMTNGHRAYAVVSKEGPFPPSRDETADGIPVTVAFSPFEMSRCRIVAWADGEIDLSGL
ncbi:MAG: hypothetical protein JNK37_11650 [Verrucomicrobiales bacterium]|nr:hypothetical protein [Verrucomicrobiales bacterium]